MRPPRFIRTFAVFAFAAWMTLCCCERKAIAEWIGFAVPSSSCCASSNDAAEESELPPCCRSTHCADTESAPTDAPMPHGLCDAQGCCDRFSGPMTSLDVPTDQVGVELTWRCDFTASAVSTLVALEQANPPPILRELARLINPPPKLLLLISRRIRI